MLRKILFFVLLCLSLQAVISQNQARQFKHGAVAADATCCSKIGADILKQNGSAVDAWISSVICLGVYHPMSSGLGGGGVALVYNREKEQFTSYDFSGVAPDKVNDAKLEERIVAYPRTSMYGKYSFGFWFSKSFLSKPYHCFDFGDHWRSLEDRVCFNSIVISITILLIYHEM